MIELMDITKKYGSNIVLDKLNFRFPDFGLFLIRGYNGSGKTTLLNILSFIDKDFIGNVVVDNNRISSLSKKNQDKFRENNIIYIKPRRNLLSFFNIKENLCFENNLIDDELIKHLDLTKSISEISGGEEILIALTKAINSPKKILLLDEITSQLDENNTKKVMEKLINLSKSKLVIFVTHDFRILNEYKLPIFEMCGGKLNDLHK